MNTQTIYTLFMPFIVDRKPLRAEVHAFVSSLPGFVKIEGGTEWISDFSYGCMAYFANQAYVRQAEEEIRAHTFGKGRNAGNLTKIYIESVYQPADDLVLDAAAVAFKHTPSATHYVCLETAMLRYQASHAINAEFTQR